MILFIVSTAAMIMAWLIPISSGSLRLAWLAAWAGLVAGFTGLLWKRPLLRLAPLMLAALVCLPWVLPGHPLDRDRLRADYLQRLTAFEGTMYFWGGENSRGIDCSGLPRKALRDAMLHQGLTTLNGRGIREFTAHWWFDASARALAQGYRNYTVGLQNKGSIRTMNTTGMVPGDLAVTEDGRHVMVYLGADQWIQADPGAGKVTIENGRTAPNHWFDAPVNTRRWSELAAGSELRKPPRFCRICEQVQFPEISK